MSQFTKYLIRFLIPCFLILLPIVFLIYSGEIFLNCERIAKENKKYVFGLAYTEIGRQFKFLNVSENEKRKVIALGSSRVMQFRKEMFNTSFYNAGGAVQDLPEYEDFLRNLPPEKTPELLIIGIDQWMFNLDYRSSYEYSGGRRIQWSDYSDVTKIFFRSRGLLSLMAFSEENYRV